MLNFLNIAALAGLAGVVVPLLIHLFARSNPGTVFFSSLKFFRSIESQAIRRLKMTELILLALRTLTIFCIVAAFAHPVLKGVRAPAGGGGSVRTAVILDRSASMSATGPFSILQQRAGQILASFGPDVRTALFWSDTLSADIVDVDPGTLRRRVAKAGEATVRKGDLGFAMQRALAWVNRGQAADREMLLLSDLQRSNMPQQADTTAAVLNGGLVLFPAGIHPSNIGITGCGLEKQILRAGGTVTVYVELTASGGEGSVTTAITCMQNGKTAARRLVTMPASGIRRFRFELPADTRGWNRCLAEIDNDRYEADNRRYFSYRIPVRIRILLLGSTRERLVLPELALSAVDESGPIFTITKSTPEEGPPAAFQHFDVIILTDYPRLTPPQAAALRDYILRGGTCIFMPGSSIDLKTYDERLFQPLLKVRLEIKRALTGYHTLGRIDQDHPIITPMFEHTYLPAHPLRVYTYIDFSGTQGRNIISLSGGAPLLTEFRTGSGRCLVFSSGLAPAWSNLPLTTFFAPLLFQCALYGGSGDNTPAFSAFAGEPVTIICDASLMQRETRVVTPAGRIVRLLPALKNDMMSLRIDDTDEMGIYEVFAGDSLLACVAVNVSPEESKMTFHDGQSLQLLYPALTIDTADPAKPAGEYLRRRRYGRDVWREMLIAGLLFLALEMVVAGARVRKKQRGV